MLYYPSCSNYQFYYQHRRKLVKIIGGSYPPCSPSLFPLRPLLFLASPSPIPPLLTGVRTVLAGYNPGQIFEFIVAHR